MFQVFRGAELRPGEVGEDFREERTLELDLTG
jgi:hypothetical protein